MLKWNKRSYHISDLMTAERRGKHAIAAALALAVLLLVGLAPAPASAGLGADDAAAPAPTPAAAVDAGAATTASGSAGGGSDEAGGILAVGASPRPLALTDLAGARHAVPAPGRWTLVFFWSLFCQSCLEEMPLIQEELAKVASGTCASFFVALDTAARQQALQNYVDKRKFSCTVLLEEIASDSYVAADAFGVTTTPATFLLDPAGKITFVREGPFDLEELFTVLRQCAMPGK